MGNVEPGLLHLKVEECQIEKLMLDRHRLLMIYITVYQTKKISAQLIVRVAQDVFSLFKQDNFIKKTNIGKIIGDYRFFFFKMAIFT